MRKKLLLNLLFTLLLSTALTGIVFAIWYNNKTMEFEEGQETAIAFVVLTIFQNLIIALLTLPVLFQINAANYKSSTTRLLYLLASPVCSIIILWFLLFKGFGKEMLYLLVPATSFCIINFLFFQRVK